MFQWMDGFKSEKLSLYIQMVATWFTLGRYTHCSCWTCVQSSFCRALWAPFFKAIMGYTTITSAGRFTISISPKGIDNVATGWRRWWWQSPCLSLLHQAIEKKIPIHPRGGREPIEYVWLLQCVTQFTKKGSFFSHRTHTHTQIPSPPISLIMQHISLSHPISGNFFSLKCFLSDLKRGCQILYIRM